jgi:hypothetical protein
MNRFNELIQKFGKLNVPCFKETLVGKTQDNIEKFYNMYWGLYSETTIERCEECGCYLITGRNVNYPRYMFNLFTYPDKIGDMKIPCSFLQVLIKYHLVATFYMHNGQLAVKLCPEEQLFKDVPTVDDYLRVKALEDFPNIVNGCII